MTSTQQSPSPFRSLVPGAVQGAATVVFGHPFDTAKTRLQAGVAGDMRSTTLKMLAKMIKREGFASLYRGVGPPLLMMGTKRSVQFSVWEAVKKIDSTTGALWSNDVKENPFFAGAIAGAVGTIIGCPMHVLKIQTQNTTRTEMKNALVCALKIWKCEGFFGFYRGLSWHVGKDTVFAATYLGLYEEIKLKIEADYCSQGPSAVAFSAGLLASVVTWLLWYPLDTVKTFVQAKQPLHAMLQIETSSLFRLMYTGLPAALVRAGPVSGLAMVTYEVTRKALGLHSTGSKRK